MSGIGTASILSTIRRQASLLSLFYPSLITPAAAAVSRSQPLYVAATTTSTRRHAVRNASPLHLPHRSDVCCKAFHPRLRIIHPSTPSPQCVVWILVTERSAFHLILARYNTHLSVPSSLKPFPCCLHDSCFFFFSFSYVDRTVHFFTFGLCLCMWIWCVLWILVENRLGNKSGVFLYISLPQVMHPETPIRCLYIKNEMGCYNFKNVYSSDIIVTFNITLTKNINV